MQFIDTISKLFGASNPKRYFKGAFWMLITRVVSMGVSLLTTFYVARTLGPQNFGELSYALSLISLLGFISAFASSTIICRDLVKNEYPHNQILGTAWVVSFLGTFTSLIIVVSLALFLPHDQITFAVIGILCLAQLFTPLQVTQNVFFANADTKQISLGQLAIHICISTAKVIAMVNGQGVLVLAAIMFFEQLLSALTFSYLYIRSTKNSLLNWQFNVKYAKYLILSSFPFVIIVMSSAVAGRIDQIFIKHFIDTTTVGLYNVAVQFSEIWQVLPQLFIAALYPALINAHTSKLFYKKRVLAFALFIIGFCLLASLFTTVIAPFIIPLIYGSAFIASVPLLQIYCWSLAGSVIGYLITNILATENRRKIQIYVGLVPMFINILLNLLWIPIYGAEGAAWATVISYSLAPIIPFFFSPIRTTFLYKQHNKI